MLPTLLTILTLMKCPPDTAYDPYARGVPSRHTPDTAYDPYARGVPSRHAPDTAYDPYACLVSTLPTCLQRRLPSLRFRTTSIVYGGLLAYTIKAIAEICSVAFSANRSKGKLVSIFTMLWLGFKS
ncbi:hypothetical protein O181_124262 [Austropuccinia psidii MF-1]|uniref:Uncharacterized protein n=1 Tax=Austropuccinia psidii MF-1 TaxID=1389203 RepID=A0A9Q3KPB4_9BASI|nr:hypothetical protein [Austropuccinia psidii MF-1]